MIFLTYKSFFSKQLTIVTEFEAVCDGLKVVAINFSVTDRTQHNIQKDRNGGHTKDHQPH